MEAVLWHPLARPLDSYGAESHPERHTSQAFERVNASGQVHKASDGGKVMVLDHKCEPLERTLHQSLLHMGYCIQSIWLLLLHHRLNDLGRACQAMNGLA